MFWLDKFGLKKNRYTQPDFCEDMDTYQRRLSQLTTSEYKIFMLLREGFSKQECSQRLNLKRSDIKAQVSSIYAKLNVRSLAELIVKYHEER